VITLLILSTSTLPVRYHGRDEVSIRFAVFGEVGCNSVNLLT